MGQRWEINKYMSFQSLWCPRVSSRIDHRGCCQGYNTLRVCPFSYVYKFCGEVTVSLAVESDQQGDISSLIVTLSGKINHLVLFMKSEIITPPESPSIADHSGTLIFLIGLTILELWAFKCCQCAGLFILHEQFKKPVNSERVGLPVCYVKS